MLPLTSSMTTAAIPKPLSANVCTCVPGDAGPLSTVSENDAGVSVSFLAVDGTVTSTRTSGNTVKLV